MKEYIVLSPIRIRGKRFEAGSLVKLTEEEVRPGLRVKEATPVDAVESAVSEKPAEIPEELAEKPEPKAKPKKKAAKKK